MAKINLSQYTSTIDLPNKRLGLTAAVGAAVGVAAWLVSLLLQVIFVEPVFCRSADSFSACANGGNISLVLALILVHTAGLFALVRLNVYRPLLVVLATLVTLYGLHTWLGGMAWYEASLWYALFTAIAYALYAWIARLSSFVVSLVTMVVVVVAIRVIVTQL